MSQLREYSTFFVDRLHFGVDVHHVQETLLPVPTTPVPLTTDVVGGLINLRGQIVMALDLRARLKLPPRAPDQGSVSLILRTSQGLISLAVDHLGDVLDLDAMSHEPSANQAAVESVADDRTTDAAATRLWEALPCTVRGPLRQVVTGTFKLDHTLLLVLDPDVLADPDVCLRRSDLSISDEATTSENAGTLNDQRAADQRRTTSPH